MGPLRRTHRRPIRYLAFQDVARKLWPRSEELIGIQFDSLRSNSHPNDEPQPLIPARPYPVCHREERSDVAISFRRQRPLTFQNCHASLTMPFRVKLGTRELIPPISASQVGQANRRTPAHHPVDPKRPDRNTANEPPNLVMPAKAGIHSPLAPATSANDATCHPNLRSLRAQRGNLVPPAAACPMQQSPRPHRHCPPTLPPHIHPPILIIRKSSKSCF